VRSLIASAADTAASASQAKPDPHIAEVAIAIPPTTKDSGRFPAAENSKAIAAKAINRNGKCVLCPKTDRPKETAQSTPHKSGESITFVIAARTSGCSERGAERRISFIKVPLLRKG
jgi:hypothetical protein